MSRARPLAGPLAAFFCCWAASADAAKVDSIRTSITSDGYVFVLVGAGSATGLGQASYNNEKTDLMSIIADKIHGWIGPHAIGKTFESMDDIDRFAEEVWRKNYKRTGTVLAQALAGVDTALHDLVARERGLSVCAMIAHNMSSVCRASMPVYGSNGDRRRSPKAIVDNAVANRDAFNISAFKFQIMDRMGGDVDIKLGRTEELIPLARKQVGHIVPIFSAAIFCLCTGQSISASIRQFR